jgi:hypothetical protein
MKDIIVAMVAVIPPLITALPILFKLLFQPLQTQRAVY